MSSRRHTFAAAVATIVAATCWVTVSGQTGSYRSANNQDNRLSGTYELDRSRSDDAARLAQQATRSLPAEQRDRAYQNLLTRLNAPEQISIDLQGRSVTIESTAARRVDFEADGRNRVESGPNGRVMTTHADVRGQVLNVSTSGNQGSDYTVRFEPVAGGMRVTRQLTSDVRNITVSSRSVYRKVSTQPSWTLYDDRSRYVRDDRSRYGTVAGSTVPGGMLLTAQLGQRSQQQYGARGRSIHDDSDRPERVSQRNPRRLGIRRADNNGNDALVFDFDRIRFTNGRSTPFEGTIRSVRSPDGKEIRVSQQGAVRDLSGYHASNAEHAAIGAAVGAIIGAIAAGGKGAAIGGAAGGAGTLLIEGPESR